MFIVESTNLSVQLDDRTILKNVELQIRKGSIYGLLGSNGAGKTTLLKTILGLLSPSFGKITMFGLEHTSVNRSQIMRKVGNLIENASLYPFLTAYQNLKYVQQVYALPKSNIFEVLNLCRLADRANDKVSTYSLGMKQRLGLAMALVVKPELVILDEPTNGLDPNGIIEFRELVKETNAIFGTTFIFSSHLLSEVEKLATDIGVIVHGELLIQGGLESVLHKKEMVIQIEIDGNQMNNLQQILAAYHYENTAQKNNILEIKANSQNDIVNITRLLLEKEISFYGIFFKKNNLEQFFLDTNAA